MTRRTPCSTSSTELAWRRRWTISTISRSHRRSSSRGVDRCRVAGPQRDHDVARAGAGAACVGVSTTVPRMSASASERPSFNDWFDGWCLVCGEHHRFVRDRIGARETFRCPSCNASLRYRGQARALLRHFESLAADCVATLVQSPQFRQLEKWEPGQLGPFRRHLRKVEGYQVSTYAPDAQPGEVRDGVRCEDLMRLSYPSDSFDLVITSDVFEHVRRPARRVR